jgi:hypothetical protein
LARAENLTASRPAVIAKQSIPRSSYLDCFAEPVIGRAFARPVGADPLARNDGDKRYFGCGTIRI